MTFKINMSEKSGKTYKLEAEAVSLIGKQLHDKIDGKEISSDLEGYEFEITGTSDKSGFTSLESVEGTGLNKVLLTYGKAMKKKPRKEGKKKNSKNKPKGLRLRKTVRGKVISEDIVQINLKVLKEGGKKLCDVYPEQCQPKTKENRKTKRAQAKAEEKKEAEKPVEPEKKELIDKSMSNESASEQSQENSESEEKTR